MEKKIKGSWKGRRGGDKGNRMENPKILVIRQEHSEFGDGIMCGTLGGQGVPLKFPFYPFLIPGKGSSGV